MNADTIVEKDEKPMMFVGEHKPEKLIEKLPIKAIVFPRFVAGEDYHIEKISQSSAFKSVITSTITQTPFADKESLQMVTNLVRSVPSYLLVFGENKANCPKLSKEF